MMNCKFDEHAHFEVEIHVYKLEDEEHHEDKSIKSGNVKHEFDRQASKYSAFSNEKERF